MNANLRITEPQPRDHQMGVSGALAYVVGSMVGSGIFMSPSSILRHTGSVGLSLLVWCLCGIFSIFGVLAYVELGTSVPVSGADYAYMRHAGWPSLAFVFVWINVLALPCSLAIVLDTLSEYVVQSAAYIILPECYLLLLHKLISLIVLWFLIYVNLKSLREVIAPLQIIATVCKVLAMLFIIGVGFYKLIFREDGRANFANPWAHTNYHPGSIVLAIYAGLWAYSGYERLNYGTEEVRQPHRTFPRAQISGLLFVSFMYMVLNIAYFAVVPSYEMRANDAIAARFSHRLLPAQAAYLVPLLITANLLGNSNANIFAATRYFYAAARGRQMPRCVALLGAENDCPIIAVLLFGCLSSVALLFGSFHSLLYAYTFCLSVQRFFTMLALLKIRLFKIKVHPNAVRYPLAVHITFTVISWLLCIVPVFQLAHLCASGFLAMILFYGLYYALNYFEEHLRPLTKVDNAMSLFFQKLFLLFRPSDDWYIRRIMSD